MVSVKDIDWLSSGLLTITPLLSIYALLSVPIVPKTAIWALTYYFITGFGITAGYHRYWSHRSYDAAKPFQVWMALAGAGAVEGSIKWWSRHHRAHHRWTDTDKDPYAAHRGFLHSHILWMMIKDPSRSNGKADISDLKRDPVVNWQHRNFVPLMLFMGFVFPTLVAGLGWGDWKGGYFYAGIVRLVFLHHATFCVNSLAHWLGEHTYDDRQTPRDHFFTAIVTLGEGYHNFHHEFPSDFRNAIRFWQYDPTKWLIWLSSKFGLTYNLNTFPDNEIQKGRIAMQEKKILAIKQQLDYGKPLASLPSYTWSEFQDLAQSKQLLVIENVIYDVAQFIDLHPGGRVFLKSAIGRDVTVSFNGGVYNHHNAARNLMQHMRFGKVAGDIPECDRAKDE
ncbi:acyl-CoA desaturase [Gaertneriomyces semiglobifer]|nr:acyl-CoA desaturase [Gaertneriomyces semiglobifer]